MRLTIIPIDSAVYKDNVVYHDLDLTNCNIPSDIHALQWGTDSGWIEFTDLRANQNITELPAWATSCVTVWAPEFKSVSRAQ